MLSGKVSIQLKVFASQPVYFLVDPMKKLIVWDDMKGKALHRLETPHEGNIFSVVWLPGDDRGLLASGAGDCRICLLDITSSTVLRAVAGHTGRVKRLAVAGDNPGLIWSGMVWPDLAWPCLI